jgi:hypothetical protein
MSLLEKAIRGSVANDTQTRSSLFSRALASREPASVAFDVSGLAGLERDAAALPAYFDSLLALWSMVSERVPLAAIALFLAKDGFLTLAAQNGFPLGPDSDIPLSIASPRAGWRALEQEERALVAPALGIPLSLSLYASSMIPRSGQSGLWVYHDPLFAQRQDGSLSALDESLTRIAGAIPSFTMTAPTPDPAAVVLTASSSYPSASLLFFDLRFLDIDRDPRFRGITANALRSAFLGACGMILALGGSALPIGELEVLCVLGSAPTLDPDLALFQFTKTLKRIMPFIAAASFPRGRALRFDPRSDSAREELSRFISE